MNEKKIKIISKELFNKVINTNPISLGDLSGHGLAALALRLDAEENDCFRILLDPVVRLEGHGQSYLVDGSHHGSILKKNASDLNYHGDWIRYDINKQDLKNHFELRHHNNAFYQLNLFKSKLFPFSDTYTHKQECVPLYFTDMIPLSIP